MARLGCVLVLGILMSLAIPAAFGHGQRGTSKRALYFWDNDSTGASIITLRISADDGLLSSPTRISTGGKGLLAMMHPLIGNGPPILSGPDSTFSQSSIVVDGNVRILKIHALYSM